jgi:hypothetical protein
MFCSAAGNSTHNPSSSCSPHLMQIVFLQLFFVMVVSYLCSPLHASPCSPVIVAEPASIRPSSQLVRWPPAHPMHSYVQLLLSLIHATCISCCMWLCRIEPSPAISSKQSHVHTYRREETIYPCKDDIMVRSYLCISSPEYSSFIRPFSSIFDPENYIFF